MVSINVVFWIFVILFALIAALSAHIISVFFYW